MYDSFPPSLYLSLFSSYHLNPNLSSSSQFVFDSSLSSPLHITPLTSSLSSPSISLSHLSHLYTFDLLTMHHFFSLSLLLPSLLFSTHSSSDFLSISIPPVLCLLYEHSQLCFSLHQHPFFNTLFPYFHSSLSSPVTSISSEGTPVRSSPSRSRPLF